LGWTFAVRLQNLSTINLLEISVDKISLIYTAQMLITTTTLNGPIGAGFGVVCKVIMIAGTFQAACWVVMRWAGSKSPTDHTVE
jgi:hypothetical protein